MVILNNLLITIDAYTCTVLYTITITVGAMPSNQWNTFFKNVLFQSVIPIGPGNRLFSDIPNPKDPFPHRAVPCPSVFFVSVRWCVTPSKNLEKQRQFRYFHFHRNRSPRFQNTQPPKTIPLFFRFSDTMSVIFVPNRYRYP